MDLVVLSPDQISQKILRLQGWSVSGSCLKKSFNFPDFSSALAFVNTVGDIAEKLQHHPDIHLSWGKVVITTTTHDVGGLTDHDFSLAQYIDGPLQQRVVRYKVPGGKLIVLKATLQGDFLRSVTFAGDFFLMPSDALPRIEEALEGFCVSDIDQLEDVLSYVISRENVRISGFEPKDVVAAVKQLAEEKP